MNAATTSVTANASPARRSRRLAKRNHAPTCRRELFVYDGTDLVGVVKITGKKATAFNCAGDRIGVFTSLQAAIAAFDTPVLQR
jgi:hypothetical protein